MANETPSQLKPEDKNLRQALLALGLLIASGVVGFLATDMVSPSSSQAMVFVMAGLGVFLMIMAVIYAVITLTRTTKEMKENKSGKNQGAVIISIIVLGLIAYELFSRLIF
jgi:heme A synthase